MRTHVSSQASRVSRGVIRSLSSTTRRPVEAAGTGENREQANDPTPTKDTPNVSKTNETAVSSRGAYDHTLQETTQEAEKKRQMQAPNRAGVWSRNQMPRELAMSGPRFEQTIMEMQVGCPGFVEL